LHAGSFFHENQAQARSRGRCDATRTRCRKKQMEVHDGGGRCKNTRLGFLLFIKGKIVI